MKIRALTIYGLNLSVASLLCSCKPTQVKGDVKEKTVEADAEGATAGNTSADRAMNDSDTVAVPSAVTGALLTCRTVESSNAIEVRVGCNFSDEKGARIPLASLASKANFSYTNTLPSGLTVNILPADSTYEGTYVFNGTDFASTNAFIQIVQFNVGLVGLVKGGADAVIGGLGKDIATPPAARWVRESTTDTNSNKLCDAGETCIYVGNGLYWLRDTGVAASHVLSSQTCNKFTYLGKYWSLPMLDAMKIAFAKGIWDLAGASSLNLTPTPYFSGQGMVPGVANYNDTTIYAINFSTGVQTTQIRSDVLHTVCVSSMNP